MSGPNKEVVELVKKLVLMLVDEPDSVSFEVVNSDNMVIIEVRAAEETGKVLGKGGQLAVAIRTLLKAIGSKEKIRYEFSVLDSD